MDFVGNFNGVALQKLPYVPEAVFFCLPVLDHATTFDRLPWHHSLHGPTRCDMPFPL